MFGKRILILAPHPDDEVVACAAAIGRAREEGATLFVFFPTHGCVARETLWPWQRRCYDFYVKRRLGEAEQTAHYLGITAVNRPLRPARFLWRQLPGVYAEVQLAIATCQIDQIWTPAYEGGNADHDALNAMASRLTSKLNVLEFAEYNFNGGKIRSQQFPFPNGTEQTLVLTPHEQEYKRAALEIYKSEKRNLNYVDVRQECFRPLAAYDYSQPPHPGTLWYTRFHCVPFRHPRVDFTKPADVTAVITRYLSSAP